MSSPLMREKVGLVLQDKVEEPAAALAGEASWWFK
jgi:hypothetical protein